MTGMSSSRRWLYDPWTDLLLGCGGLYAGVFALMCLPRLEVRSFVPQFWMPLVLLMCGVPHCVQYLWISAYTAREAGRERDTPQILREGVH